VAKRSYDGGEVVLVVLAAMGLSMPIDISKMKMQISKLQRKVQTTLFSF